MKESDAPISGLNGEGNANTQAMVRLVDLMARLRAPGGCPWDP